MPVEYNGAKFAALGERLAAANGWQLKVGVVGPGAAAVEEDSDLTLAALALIHEYGTEDGHIPERAPLRKTLLAHRDEIAVLMRKIAFAIYRGGDAEALLNELGAKIAGWVKLTIRAKLDPPNALSTIRRKGSSTPLVDDSQLINAYTWLVEQVGGVDAVLAEAA